MQTVNRFTRLVALKAFLVISLLLALGAWSSPGQTASDKAGAEGLRFEVQCRESGGRSTCTLVVSGLPAPLNDTVSVTVRVTQTDKTGEPAHQGFVATTMPSSEVLPISVGAPMLVSRALPAAPPPPHAAVPQVPEGPPKSL